MIRHAADNQSRAIESRRDAAEIAMEFVAQGFVGEEGKTILRGPHRVNEDVREGLGHGVKRRGKAERPSTVKWVKKGQNGRDDVDARCRRLKRHAVPPCRFSPPIGHRTAKRFRHAAQEWTRSGLSWEMRSTRPIPHWTTTWSRHAAQGCRALARLPWVSRVTPPPSRSRTAMRSRQAALRGRGDVRVTEPRWGSCERPRIGGGAGFPGEPR